MHLFPGKQGLGNLLHCPAADIFKLYKVNICTKQQQLDYMSPHVFILSSFTQHPTHLTAEAAVTHMPISPVTLSLFLPCTVHLYSLPIFSLLPFHSTLPFHFLFSLLFLQIIFHLLAFFLPFTFFLTSSYFSILSFSPLSFPPIFLPCYFFPCVLCFFFLFTFPVYLFFYFF